MESEMMIFPKPLKSGDTVAIVSPAFPISEQARDECVSVLEQMGFRVRLGECLEKLYNYHNYLAGDGKDRAADLNRMFLDPEVKAIFCARGGYGSAHVMKHLDYEMIRKNPKIFVGYSDITNLHSALQMFCNLVTFHGPMVYSNMRQNFDEYSRDSLMAAIGMKEHECLEFLNPPGEDGFKTVKPGRVQGIITGGNLSLIARGLGTFFQLETAGKILFLEDIEEKIPALDMYITQMEYAGLFEHAAGILFGDFTDCTNDRYDETFRMDDFLADRFRDYRIPIMSHVRSGHDAPMGTIPFGTCCHMDAEAGRICFSR